MAIAIFSKTYKFEFLQGPLQPSNVLIEDSDEFSRLHLTPIISDKNPVALGEPLIVYAVQWDSPLSSENYEFDATDYATAVGENSAKGLALRIALGGNSGLTLVSCDEVNDRFSGLTSFGSDDFMFVGGKIISDPDDRIQDWANDLILNIWNFHS